MRATVKSMVALLVANLMLPFVAFGQSDAVASAESIRITGRVVDSGKAPLPQTSVKLTPVGPQTVSTAVLTGDDGRFAFQSAPSQSYQLRFDAAGFISRKLTIPKHATARDVDIGLIVLPIGEITEGPMVGVQARGRKAKPVTVCEALVDRVKFSGKPLAVVGRMDCGRSLIDHFCFLVQDRCEQRVTTDGYMWPNKVLILDFWEEGMPLPPATTPALDQAALRKGLSRIRKTTTRAEVNGEWAVAYGLSLTDPKLRNGNCGDDIGCGGFVGAPIAIIAHPHAVQTLGGGNDALPEQ